MRQSSPRDGFGHRWPVFAFLALGLFVLWSASGARAAEGTAVVEYARSADSIVVSFGEVLGEVAGEDLGPQMELHGDGLLVVNYPPYMKRAGTYTLRLSRKETESLLGSLLEKGLADFDGAAVRRQQRAARTGKQRGTVQAPLLFSSDPSIVYIVLRVDRYVSADRRLTANAIDRTIRWTGLRDDARRHPDVDALQNLAAAVAELRALMERPDLIGVD